MGSQQEEEYEKVRHTYGACLLNFGIVIYVAWPFRRLRWADHSTNT